MKNTKINLLLMAALIAVQTTVHAKDKVNDKPEQKQPRTWRQAAYDNRLYILGGSAAVGLGALGYVFGEDIRDWISKQSPETQQKAIDVLEKSIDKDLQVIEEKQEAVAEKIDAKKHSTAQQKEIVKEEKEIAQVQQQVAQKQSWLQSIGDFLGSRNSWKRSGPIQDELDANNAEYLAENPDYRSSDDVRSDRERDAYAREHGKAIAQLQVRKYRAENYPLDKAQMEKAISNKYNNHSSRTLNDYLDAGNDKDRLEKKLNRKYNDMNADIDREYAEPRTGGYFSDVFGGDFSRPKNTVSRAAESTKNAYNEVASAVRNAADSTMNYIKGDHSPKETLSKLSDDLKSEEEMPVYSKLSDSQNDSMKDTDL